MSILNELKKIRKDCPNNKELGAKVSEFLDRHKTCCDNLKNIEDFTELDSGPYGWDVSGTKCKACGKIIEVFDIK